MDEYLETKNKLRLDSLQWSPNPPSFNRTWLGRIKIYDSLSLSPIYEMWMPRYCRSTVIVINSWRHELPCNYCYEMTIWCWTSILYCRILYFILNKNLSFWLQPYLKKKKFNFCAFFSSTLLGFWKILWNYIQYF